MTLPPLVFPALIFENKVAVEAQLVEPWSFLVEFDEVTSLGLPGLDSLSHRYLRKVDCSSFVMCQLLALPLPRAFLRQQLTVLTRQARQAVHAINQSIF